ncbi:hypothetical protein B5M42_024280 [Paenibacillus athensensis]|nr:hypothetical protein [Paenibacillus athensensis]MCD1261916.1 hypothetical protein [Paenibacillus athensensis]
MATHNPALSKDSTIYNYKLMKRMRHSLVKIAFYLAMLAALAGLGLKHGSWAPYLLSYPILLVAHVVLVRLYFQFTVGGMMRNWTFHWGFFWIGLLPVGNASIRLVSRVQLHLFWIGLTGLAVLYPWMPPNWMYALMLVHMWMLVPRLWMLFRFRPYRKAGLIKITGKDTSCYLH